MRPILLALTAALALAALALALAFGPGRAGVSAAVPMVTDSIASVADAPLELEPQRAEPRRDLTTRPASVPAAPAPVRPGRSLFFRVVDEADEPLAGALVRALGQPGVQSLPTNASGEGRLDGVLPSYRVLLVGAPERRVLRVPIGREGTDPERPLVFVLPPGNRLELVLRDCRGEPLQGVPIELISSSRLFEGTDEWGPSFLHLAISGTPFTKARWTKRGGGVTFRTEEDGRVRLCGIRPSVPFELRIRQGLGEVLLEERFQGPPAGELLRREFVLDASWVDLAGEVVDERGEVLFDVRVELHDGVGFVWAETDLFGKFEFPELLVSPRPVELRATIDGYDPLRLRDLVLGPDAGLPLLVMRHGPGFHLTVVDDDGNALVLDQLRVAAPGLPAFQVKNVGAGRYRFPDLPPGQYQLFAQIGPHTFEREFDPGVDAHTWVLPSLGQLVVVVMEGVLPSDRSGQFGVRVTSLDDPSLVTVEPLIGNGATSTMHLGPGKWRVQLGRLTIRDDKLAIEAVYRSVEVEIHAGEPTRLDLD